MPGPITPKKSPPPTLAGAGPGGGGPLRLPTQDDPIVLSIPKGMQHVERSKLYTDVVYRVKYVAALVGFTRDDQLLVAELAPKVEPMLPDFIEAVYRQLFKFDVLAESFLSRMQGFDGQVVYKLENLTINSEQITFRRSMLLKYFVRTMRAMTDFETLIPYLDWVAAIHSKQSFIPIEFIHCNGLLGFMSGEFIKLVAQLQLPPEKTLKAQGAMTRMLWVQNDLFAMHAVADGQEYEDAHLASPLKTEPEKNNVLPPAYPEQKFKRRQSFGIPGMPKSASQVSESAVGQSPNISCTFASIAAALGPPAARTATVGAEGKQPASSRAQPPVERPGGPPATLLAPAPESAARTTASSTRSSGRDTLVTVATTVATTASDTTATGPGDLGKGPDTTMALPQMVKESTLHVVSSHGLPSLTSSQSPLVGGEGTCPHHRAADVGKEAEAR